MSNKNQMLNTDSFMSLIAGTQEGEFEYVENMDIDSCYPDPEQPRYKNLSAEGVADITATFDSTKGKIYQPIVVRSKDELGHKIVMGGRRWLASKLWGNTTLPALIVNGELDSVLYLQLVENIARKPLDMREQGQAFITLKAQGTKQQAIAESLGKSNSYVSEAIMLAEMENDRELEFFNQLYEDGVCDATTMAAILRFARVSADKTKALVEWAIANDVLSRKWAKSLKKSDLEQPYEEIIAALAERNAADKTQSTKTSVPAGMTGNSDTDSNSGLKDSDGDSDGENLEDFGLTQEQDGVEPSSSSKDGKKKQKTSPESGSESDEFQKKKVGTINVTHNDKVARLLLDRVDNEEGFAWILYADDDSNPKPVRVEAAELSIIFVG